MWYTQITCMKTNIWHHIFFWPHNVINTLLLSHALNIHPCALLLALNAQHPLPPSYVPLAYLLQSC